MELAMRRSLWILSLAGFFVFQAQTHPSITIQSDLVGAFAKLNSGDFSTALLIAPFVTTNRELIRAVGTIHTKETKLFIITPKSQADTLLSRLPKGLIRQQGIIIRTTDEPVHEKILIFWHSDGTVELYLGSANVTYNQFRNIELVLQSTGMSEITGLKDHLQQLLDHTRTPEARNRSIALAKPNTPDWDRTKRKLLPLLTKKRGCQTPPAIPRKTAKRALKNTPEINRIASSHRQNLMSFLLDRIHPTVQCNYKIATMTCNDVAMLKEVQESITATNSTFCFIVDKTTARQADNPDSVIGKLCALSKQYPKHLSLKQHTGQGKTGIFHPKLFLRIPMCANLPNCQRLAIPGSLNLTTQSRDQSNILVVLPGKGDNTEVIEALEAEFDTWWKNAQPV